MNNSSHKSRWGKGGNMTEKDRNEEKEEVIHYNWADCVASVVRHVMVVVLVTSLVWLCASCINGELLLP